MALRECESACISPLALASVCYIFPVLHQGVRMQMPFQTKENKWIALCSSKSAHDDVLYADVREVRISSYFQKGSEACMAIHVAALACNLYDTSGNWAAWAQQPDLIYGMALTSPLYCNALVSLIPLLFKKKLKRIKTKSNALDFRLRFYHLMRFPQYPQPSPRRPAWRPRTIAREHLVPRLR